MNVDHVAARTARELLVGLDKQPKKDIENLIIKALDVLQENGVYACALFLHSRTSSADRTVSKVVVDNFLSLVKMLENKEPKNHDPATVLQFIVDTICNDLDTLLLVKQSWEQVLIYARHGARALTGEQ